MAKIKIILVEDHEVVREGLRALLSSQQDFEIVGEAKDGLEAVRLARKASPDVVVMDISMPVLNGLEATKQILKAVPGVRVLVLSSYDDADCAHAMTQAGVAGFLSKRTAGTYLAEAIRSVRGGRSFCSPEVVKRLRERQALLGDEKNPSTLTQREEEVLQLIAEGYPNKGIAEKLGISIKTVEKHRQGAMNKLNIHEVAGLTRYALSKGIVSERLPSRQEAPASGQSPEAPGSTEPLKAA